MKKLNETIMKQLAKSKSGKCLSKKYVNNYTKLTWRCKEGHVWEAMPESIRKGSWCPFCSRKNMGPKRLTIKEMQELAESKGGQCLSSNYINSHTKLLWKCSKGHQWQTIPNQLKQGHWCPYCTINKRKKNA